MSTAPLPCVPGWPVAFRGTTAVAAGLVTRAELRGPRFVRLFPDTYVRRTAEPPDLALRSRAAGLWVAGHGAVSGYSAAELLDASCAPKDAPAEVTVPGGGQRSHPGLLVHRDALAPDEVRPCGPVQVSTARRTAYDLARRLGPVDLVEAVVALDALARVGRFAPGEVLQVAQRYPRARGRRHLPVVVELADARAGSPMETRLRLVLVLRGLPRPEAQYPVQDLRRRRAVWLDLAYPEQRIGIEYEGADHVRPGRVLRDAGRYTSLVDDGWRMYRFTARSGQGSTALLFTSHAGVLGAHPAGGVEHRRQRASRRCGARSGSRSAVHAHQFPPPTADRGERSRRRRGRAPPQPRGRRAGGSRVRAPGRARPGRAPAAPRS